MKIKVIKEDRNLIKASLRTPILYGNIEGVRKNEAEFALIDNKGREFAKPIIITKKQLKEAISTVPSKIFDELIKEGVLTIKEDKIVAKSIEEVEKDKLIELGVKKEVVATFRPTAITKLLSDIKAELIFVVDGELISQANKAAGERKGIIKAAAKAGITDPKILALSNEELVIKTKEAIEASKDEAEEVKDILAKLKLLLDEAKYKEIETEKLSVLKVVLDKAEKHFDKEFKEFKEVIKGFETEKELLAFIGLDKDIVKLESAKEQYSDKKDAIEKAATEKEAKEKLAEKEAADKAAAEKIEADKKAKELSDKVKADKLEEVKKAEAIKAKEAKAEAPKPEILEKPKELNK